MLMEVEVQLLLLALPLVALPPVVLRDTVASPLTATWKLVLVTLTSLSLLTERFVLVLLLIVLLLSAPVVVILSANDNGAAEINMAGKNPTTVNSWLILLNM